MLYTNVKAQFEKTFDTRLQTQGNIILQKTEINPLTVPLPESGEYFLLIYQANNRSDTLFNNIPKSIKSPFEDADFTRWKLKKLSRTLETGGTFQLFYVLSAKELTDDINRIQVILFLYFPLSFITALIAGYFLSGFLLHPIENIVSKANEISLQNRIALLEQPATRDELHKLTTSLNRMLTRIQKQAQQQNAFFASASHELRTPLSVMLTELQILQADQLPAEIRPVVENQLTEVQRLNKLVNDFLLMSQLKSGSMVLHQENVDLPEMSFDILERLKSKAQLKNQHFKINLTPENGDFKVRTDKSHLTTILFNLFENSVKHGEIGSVISISVIEKENVVSIKTTNQSQSKIDNVSQLKDEFRKQDFNSEGFGLGLWIVHQLIEMIGAEFVISYLEPEFNAEIIIQKAEI